MRLNNQHDRCLVSWKSIFKAVHWSGVKHQAINAIFQVLTTGMGKSFGGWCTRTEDIQRKVWRLKTEMNGKLLYCLFWNDGVDTVKPALLEDIKGPHGTDREQRLCTSKFVNEQACDFSCQGIFSFRLFGIPLWFKEMQFWSESPWKMVQYRMLCWNNCPAEY